jgi:thiamine-monophosphate kinase
MGLEATAAVVCLALREDLTLGFAKRIYRGMAKASSEFGVAIIGGAVVSWDKPIALAVTVLGEAGGLKPIRRSGARVGDGLMVTGTLGGSSLGKHLRFRPRLKEGHTLNENCRIHSMIDISDGLLADLGHILAESDVGAVLFAEKIPLSRAARRLSLKSGKTPLHHALYDGEDFELLFSARARECRKILTQNPLRKLSLSHIGEVRKKKGLFVLYPDGKERRLEPVGYEHFPIKKSS